MNKEVSIVAVTQEDNKDKLLMGQRNDSGKWVLPGGHIEEGESPSQAAIRELKEETDITASEDDLVLMGSEELIQTGTEDTMLTVHSFTLQTDQLDTDSSNDPDNEVGTWAWVEVQNGLPSEIRAELHNIDDITLNQLGLLEPLEKMAGAEMLCDSPSREALAPHIKQWKYNGGDRLWYHMGDPELNLEDKKGSIKSFTKQSNMKGELLPNALPQEQTFTYPYDEGNPKLIDRNYNGGNTLKRKELEREELERKMKNLKDLVKRSK